MPGRKPGPTAQQIAAAKVYSLPEGWTKSTLGSIPVNYRLDDETIGVLKVAMAAGELSRAKVNVFKLSFTQECKVRSEVRGVGKPFLDAHGRAVTEDLKPLKGASKVGTSQYSCETVLYDGKFRKDWVKRGFNDPVQFHIDAVENCSARVIATASLERLKRTITDALDDLEVLARFDTGMDIEKDIALFLLDSRKDFMSRFENITTDMEDEYLESYINSAIRKGKKLRRSDPGLSKADRLTTNEEQDVMTEQGSWIDEVMEPDAQEYASTTQPSSIGKMFVTSDDEGSASISQPVIPGLALDRRSRPRSIDSGSSARGTRPAMRNQSQQREKTHRRTISAVYQAYGSNVVMPQLPSRRSEVELQSFALDNAPMSGYTLPTAGRSMTNTDVRIGQRPNKSSALSQSKVPAEFDIETAGPQGFLQDEVSSRYPTEPRNRQDSGQSYELDNPWKRQDIRQAHGLDRAQERQDGRQPYDLDSIPPEYDPEIPLVDLSAMLRRYEGTNPKP